MHTMNRRQALTAITGGVLSAALAESAFATEALPSLRGQNLRRTWKDSGGQFQVEATLLAANTKHIVIKKTDGQLKVVQLEKLSGEDQTLVKMLAKATLEESSVFEPIRAGVYRMVQVTDRSGTSSAAEREWKAELDKSAPGWWHNSEVRFGVTAKPRPGTIFLIDSPARLVCWANTEIHSWVEEDFKGKLSRLELPHTAKVPERISKWAQILESKVTCSFQDLSRNQIAEVLSMLASVPVSFDEVRLKAKSIDPDSPVSFSTKPGQNFLSVLESLGKQCADGAWSFNEEGTAITIGTDMKLLGSVLTEKHKIPQGVTKEELLHIVPIPVDNSLRAKREITSFGTAA